MPIAAMSAEQGAAIAVLIGAVAIVVGHGVFYFTPKQHHPRVAGVMASNVVISGLGAAGVSVARDLVIWWLMGSVLALVYSYADD